MNPILPTEETTEFEDRIYLNPQTSIDETNTFISNLRDTQNANNAQILEQTRNLGTDVPSNLGGLTGGEGYFTSRYQIPQTNTNVANLRATAQAAALNQALANEQAMWKKRYNDAYRSYQKSAYDKSNSGGSGGNGGNGNNSSTWNGDITNVATDYSAEDVFTLDSNNPEDTGEGIRWVVNPASVGTNVLEYYRIDETKNKNDPEYQILYRQQADGSFKRVGS